ncbi:MAG: hypothetical protein Q4B70_10325 [Lachnospiraceae bacterium]|nr:hypothetical protein [Lachnospiraceae bacterium]
MAKLSIEELIDELAVFIDGCGPARFAAGKVAVPKEDFLAMVEELKLEIPPEIERSKEILNRKDMIIAEAQTKADSLIGNAAKEAGLMIDENEIVAMANMRADEIIKNAKLKAAEILDKAEEEAEGIQLGAMQYTSSMMAGLENMFQTLYDNQKEQLDIMVSGLGVNLDKIKNNRAEIDTQLSLWTEQTTNEEDDTDEMK